jgi:uncharacterized membrane protein
MSGSGDLDGYRQTIPDLTLHNPLIRLLLPLLLTLAYYLGCSALLPLDRALILGGLMVAYMIPPSGKESIIPLGIVLGIPWPMMAATVVTQDILTGLFMLLNLDYAYRIPRLGPWIAEFLGQGKEFMAGRPWLSRWGVLGLAFFVVLPFQGTGGVGATLVGWIMGLPPGKILLGIGMGAVVEGLVFALGAEVVWTLVSPHLILGIEVFLAILFIALLQWFVSQKWRRTGQK